MAPRKQRNLAVLHEPLPSTSARLETEYEKALCQTKLIIGEEKNRVLRVHALLADHDKEDLCSEVEDTKSHLARAEKIGSEAQEQLKQAQNDIDHLRNSLRAHLREIDDLKSNISELQVTVADSSKLLAEKRAMTREISNLKHEIEHLRSQNSSHQALMSEKLSLERQLRSLEVELQNEKNALEKARLKCLEQSEMDSKIISELGEFNKELARERREREKIENDMKTEALEWARHRSVLENKLATLRNKLRQSKDNSDLDHPTILDDVGQEDQRRKRSTSRFETEITIATPGAAAAPRRISRVPTVPGEKSTFSTTPFLNRTSTTAESSDESETNSDAEEVRRRTKRIKEDAEHDRPKPRKPSSSKATKPTKQRRPAKSQDVSVMVNSDDDHEVMQSTKPQHESSTSTTNKNAGIKRRLLPRKPEGTLFDDDEDGFGDPNKDRRRIPSGFRALRGGQFGLGAPSRRLGGGRGLEAYADISPLRRDIRAARD
ncbi:uncharacterized protein BDCG_09497 [Blastomyces dermatitidis ER-3]|uniref:Uncharacterized protein n=1 Tax=Ajellomyces dermatitidis (strain ER-3 / ATCC MYA-2586) TaxID=559297 RepID=A0ABP2ERD7_AJEDR|nr:uncharacterized protein BDCG_09497 [Blastomyces dermatitidis ER-3]EEQ86228.2 hypothetical protein BDCG_09497 [Blastomyces dermatitidis ER-3]